MVFTIIKIIRKNIIITIAIIKSIVYNAIIITLIINIATTILLLNKGNKNVK